MHKNYILQYREDTASENQKLQDPIKQVSENEVKESRRRKGKVKDPNICDPDIYENWLC